MQSKQLDDKNQEIEKNFQFFQSVLPDLVKDHQGRYVLLRHEEIVGIYDTVHDAQMTGEKFYADNLFSVQKVETRPIELGIFSHAVPMG